MVDISGLTELEKQQVFKILSEIKDGGSHTYNDLINDIWEEIPVDIDTFIDDEKYMRTYFYPDNKSCIVYPRWRKELKIIFEDPYKYSEIAFTGGIGLGKSEAAKLGLAYLLYRLMCLKNPQLFYNKPAGKPIVILFFNNTLTLANDVLLQPFTDMIITSPWFMERGRTTGREHIKYIPNKNIELMAGSKDSHALGMDIFACIIDEINFASGQDVSMEKSKMMKTYAAINTRITNRFRVEGSVHGKIFMVSSKKSEYDFLEQYIQKMKDEVYFYCVDDKVWNIVPQEKTGYSGKMFNLAIGGDTLPSKIVPDNETIEDYIKQGYEIMEVPIEERQKFVLDMERSLMDIAAISVAYTTKFLNYEIISQCYTEDLNPFNQSILSIGIKDTLEIKEFFILNRIPPEVRKKPHFIHIDTSLTGDRTAIGDTCLFGRTKMETFDIQANKTIRTYKTIYKHVFNIEIECPKNSEISFQKTRDFILYLRQVGFNICGITVDGYQSADTRQILLTNGFENVDRLNFERTPEIYLNLRNALIEERIKLLKIDILERELLRVERNNQNGKITHPENTGDGHGDGADGLAGSLYNAILHEEEYMDVLSTFHLLSPADGELDKEDILKIAAGIPNLHREIESYNTQPTMPNQPERTSGNLKNWIL